MKNISNEMRDAIRRGVTTLCTCISIRRRDGATFYMTDHDEEVDTGVAVYAPINSFSRTSVPSSSDLEVDSMELHGILNSSAISRVDISSGLFDFSEVSVIMLDYTNPSLGALSLRTGWMGEVTMKEDGTFTAEVRGLTQVLTYRIGEGYSPECRASLGDKRCKVPLLPQRWQMTTGYRRGAAVLGEVAPANNYKTLNIANANFDTDPPTERRTAPTGWIQEDANKSKMWAFTSTADGVPGPKSGSRFVIHTNDGDKQSTTRNMTQIIDLAQQQVDLEGIDTGLCRIKAGVWAVCLSNVGTARLEIQFVDQFGNVGSIFDSGQTKYAEDVWYRIDCPNALIPAGARKLRVVLTATKKRSHEFGVGFDLVNLAINYPDGTYGSFEQFGDVCFVAQNTGVSGETEPAFSNSLGDLVQDGTITWKAVRSWGMVKSVRAAASDNRSFVPENLTEEAGYYDGGLITWETGRNAGRSQEIKSWKAGRLTLFQRPYYPMQPGDRVVIRPGCDKRRVTCNERFDNVINFRGEPDVPGQDEYYKTPNSQSEE